MKIYDLVTNKHVFINGDEIIDDLTYKLIFKIDSEWVEFLEFQEKPPGGVLICFKFKPFSHYKYSIKDVCNTIFETFSVIVPCYNVIEEELRGRTAEKDKGKN